MGHVNDTEIEHVGQPSIDGEVSPVGLMLLLDTLTAVADEVAELPAPLGLFATELESGLTEVLTGVGHGY